MNCNPNTVSVIPTLFEEEERTVINNADQKIIGYISGPVESFYEAKSVHGQKAN